VGQRGRRRSHGPRERRLRAAAQPGRVLSNRVKARVTEAIRPECVYMVHGFGLAAKGLRSAFGRGASDAQLITRYVTDPLMGAPGPTSIFVTIEREA